MRFVEGVLIVTVILLLFVQQLKLQQFVVFPYWTNDGQANVWRLKKSTSPKNSCVRTLFWEFMCEHWVKKKPTPIMIKDRELELNFPHISFSMQRWQALTVAAVIPIVWLDFSKICLSHPSTTASFMFCRFANFLPKGKTWGRTRQRPAMTDFHRKVNKFRQRFAKWNPCLTVILKWLNRHFILQILILGD